MRSSRLFSQFLTSQGRPISRNQQFRSLRLRQKNASSQCFRPSFRTFNDPDLIYPKNLWYLDSVREFTSTAQEARPSPSDAVMAIVDEISELTLLEVADLTELLRKKLNIEEMPTMAVMMPGMGMGMGVRGGGRHAEKVEEKAVEKTAFDLKLEGGYDAGAKIKIIKEVRTFTGLGLKEAKDLVEKAPTLLKKGVPKEEAEKIIEKMKAVGAKVIME